MEKNNMALPMKASPTYTMEVPSTKQKVRYRPFLVKEEKVLLIAHQSEDMETMVESLKQVIASCLLDPVEVEKLASFDIEYMFTQLRAKSVGEKSDVYVRCDTCEDPKAVVKLTLDLTSLEVKFNPDHTTKISLFDDVGIAMKYPDIDVVKKIQHTSESDLDAIFDIVVECIDFIYTNEEMFSAKDQTKEEVMEFLNNLTPDQFNNIKQFFETMPRLSKEITYSCPVCHKEHNKVLEGLNSFF